MKAAAFLVLLVFSCPVFSQSITLKTDFGVNGTSVTNISNDAGTFNDAIVVQPDGKIIMGGTALVRVWPNGSLDTTFKVGNYRPDYISSPILSMALQSDGKIICAYNRDSVIVCTRYNTDGSRDLSYGSTAGQALIVASGTTCYTHKIVLQADGKLLVVGGADFGGGRQLLVARLSVNGALDNSFNGNGYRLVQIGSISTEGYDAGLQSDGKIVIAGTSSDGSVDSRMAVLRLLPNGTPDNTFNGTGVYDYDPSRPGLEGGYCVRVLPDNKILIAGGTNAKAVLIRLLSTGYPDNSFNGIGSVVTQIGEFNIISEIHIRPDNKILLTGSTAVYQSPNGFDYAAFQFDATGQADNSFNGNGTMSFPLLQNEHAVGSVLQADGKFLIAGYSDSIKLMTLVKFNVNGTPDNSYGNNAINYIQAVNTDERIDKIIPQPDGKIIALIYKEAGQLVKTGAGIARYLKSGIIDSSFGVNGFAFYPEPAFQLTDALLLPNGKIIVTVNKSNFPDFPADYTTVIYCLDSNGIRYPYFGMGAGKVTFQSSYGGGFGQRLALTDNDKMIFIAGHSGDQALDVFRLYTDGEVDETFNGGRVILPADADIEFFGVAVQPDHKIVIAGTRWDDDLTTPFVRRLLPDGSTDATFGTNGTVVQEVSSNGSGEISSFIIQPDGKILIGGNTEDDNDDNGDNAAAYILRLTTFGALDTTFNHTGIGMYVNQQSSYHEVVMSGMTLHADSTMYIVGGAYDSSYNFLPFLIHVKKNGILDTTIDAAHSGWFTDFMATPLAIAMAPDSTILIAGQFNNHDQGDLFLSAYRKSNIGGRLYTFTGNGSWTDPVNWSGNIVPPTVLPSGNDIIISPVNGGRCILSTQQRIETGSSITVKTGASFIVQGSLTIVN